MLVNCGSNQNQAFQPIRPEDDKAIYEALDVYHHLPDGLVIGTLAVPKTFESLRTMRKYSELHNFDIYNSETGLLFTLISILVLFRCFDSISSLASDIQQRFRTWLG